MKLDPDCVRDILLAVEDSAFGQQLRLADLSKALPNYSEEQLRYTTLKLQEASLLDVVTTQYLRSPMPVIHHIKDMTSAGQDFLGTIREDENWKKIKSLAESAGISSLASLKDIGKSLEAKAYAPSPSSEVHIGSITLADSSQANIVGTIFGGNVSLENRQEVNFDLLEKLIQTKSEEDQKLLKEMIQELKRIAESSDPIPKSFLSKFGKKLHELTDLLVPVGTILLQIFTA